MATKDDGSESSFEVEVVDYQVHQGDPSFYNNHVFTIKVWFKRHMYAIDRSYASFCELDSRLRKQYARSNLPTLKLAGALAAIKVAKRNSASKDQNKALTFPPDMDGGRSEAKLFRRVDNAEAIGQKRKYLTGYLQNLLKIPEVVLSDLMLYFLDEESADGEPVVDQPDEAPDSQEVNILLTGQEMSTRLVRVDRKHEMSVPANSVVVWAFNTISHDIGFSIAYRNKEIYKYQRCDSHLRIIKGHFEMRNAGDVTFIWDNSYSRWRSKTVNYTIRIVSLEEYAAAQNAAAQAKKSKTLFQVQRNMVKTALVALSARLLEAKGNLIATTALPIPAVALSAVSHTTAYGGEHEGKGATADGRNGLEGGGRSGGDGGGAVGMGLHSTATAPSAQLSSVPASTNPRFQRVDTSEFLSLTDAVVEIAKLRSEKRTLQQALSGAETALVTERNIAAQYTQQYETLAHKHATQEEELTALKAEFELLRENYYNEMESKLAETLATFTVGGAGQMGQDGDRDGSGGGGGGGSGGDGGRDSRNSENESAATVAAEGDERRERGPSRSASVDGAVRMATFANATGDFQDDAEQDDTRDDNDASQTERFVVPAADVSFNQLLNLTASEVNALPLLTLAGYFLRLQEHVQLMVQRGYMTKEMESMLSKLKNEKKQLKAYAIQMKQGLDKLTTQYIHIEQDKTQLLAQVRELRDLVALLETDRRGLREHISQLLANDSVPVQSSTPERRTHSSDGSATAGTAASPINHQSRVDATPPMARSFSSGSNDSQDQPLPGPRRSTTATKSEGSLTSLLRSGLASAAAAAAAMSSFDLYDDAPRPAQSAPRAPVHPPAVTQQPAAAAIDPERSVSAEQEESTTTSASTTLVISMEDLQQAMALQSGSGMSSGVAQHTTDVEDTGSDCGYSVQDETESVPEISPHNRSPLRREESGFAEEGRAAVQEPRESAAPASTQGAAEEDSGIPFTKVTEQLRGILPTWGQLQAFRSKSLI